MGLRVHNSLDKRVSAARWIALTTGSICVITLLFFVVKKLVQASIFAQDQFIVKFNDNVDENTIASIHKKYKCEASYCSETLGFQVVTTAKNINKMMKIYSELDEVEYAEQNYVFEASYIPNDSFYSFQYRPQKVSVPSTWDVTQSNAGIRIAILDRGVQPNCPDLALKLVPGYKFIDNNTDTNDFNGHGTHVAGLAALLAAQGRSSSQIRTVIQNTCDPIIGTGTNWVYGRINADRAVRSPL